MENLDTPIAPEPQPLGYVTFDAAGNLTGSYFQLLHPDHADCHLPVDEPQRLAWVNYRANEARDGLELLPVKEPTEMPAPVPEEVTRRQGLEALFKMCGLKDSDIEAAIVAHVTDPDEQYLALNEFRTSQVFRRDRPLVAFMGQVLLLDLPALFIFAKTL